MERKPIDGLIKIHSSVYFDHFTGQESRISKEEKSITG